MFMASGYDLIVQFLGLETMAIRFLRARRIPSAATAARTRERGEISGCWERSAPPFWHMDFSILYGLGRHGKTSAHLAARCLRGPIWK